MGRIRTVKPELFGHEELFDLERECGLPVRLAFIGLFTCCDREGRFKWRPRTLKKDIMPHDDIDFARVLDALGTRGFVRQYACGTGLFGEIPTWNKHQVINNRESASDIPVPDESHYISIGSTRAARVDDASITREQTRQGEGKGKEGKGREEEGEQNNAELKPGALIVQTGERRKIADKRSDAGEAVRSVFVYWQQARGHARAHLDAKREKAIKARLTDGYSVEDLCRAVDGIAKSSHHMGQNDAQTVYDDIELICRSAANVDKFAKLAGPAQQIDHGLQRQIDVLKEWIGRPE